jgi:hypothetical protein
MDGGQMIKFYSVVYNRGLPNQHILYTSCRYRITITLAVTNDNEDENEVEDCDEDEEEGEEDYN